MYQEKSLVMGIDFRFDLRLSTMLGRLNCFLFLQLKSFAARILRLLAMILCRLRMPFFKGFLFLRYEYLRIDGIMPLLGIPILLEFENRVGQ